MLGWFASDQQMRQWRDIAISQDVILIQQEQALAGNNATMDQCFEHVFKSRP
jgi:hypothetical protein